jgi:7-carboxy-7-deazaguanine synthase
MELSVFEIFKTLQGESSFQGIPTVFIRLAGCPLNCSWCDTKHVREAEGKLISIDEIMKTVPLMGTPVVEVTGGEPLAQKNCKVLLKRLNDQGLTVLLETSGAFPLDNVDSRTHIIMDVKPPSSGEAQSLLKSNFDLLGTNDEVKFPVANREDFDYALFIIRTYEKRLWKVVFTPVEPEMEPSILAQWVLKEGPPHGRFQLQLHKILGIP